MSKGTGGTLSVMWQGITRSPSGFTGMCLVAAILIFVFGGRFLVDHHNPTDADAIWKPMSGAHWLGTNFEGKDTFTKLVLGGAEPIWVGALAAVVTVIIAVVLGALAGYLRGRFDDLVLQLTDITMTMPFITVLIIIASYFREISPWMVGLIIGLLTWPFLTRSIRAQVLSLKEREFIEAAQLQNLGTMRIVFVDILPNMAGYIFINFIIAVTNAIYAIVGLYLLGLLPSTAENWGLMIQQAWQNSAYLLPRALPFLLAPLAMIALFQVGLVLMTRSLEQALNPRLRDR
ncbi:ABC transporter permease [Phytomonospora endophytica]|uniref:Peptide/nickel transport system permease protein n=1 Tax=Phytomonospora endophytica TaxID=714109 RepID=A0A841FTZ4_9ACTN|nr:ABC transporter permease [Phytomonospora endophytica]MBB6036807.1 peptide/nickel transport system permease protein [Phytomonospora endophytica]GIG68159.1 peptide ABC transporter permease [Phytomonospora endophytica]